MSAILDRSASADTIAALLALHQPIRHRGPDDEAFLVTDGRVLGPRTQSPPAPRPGVRCGLAFRRLKILDLSEAANQPMVAADGRTALVFNGEIYNYRALRDELQSRGTVFRSQGDAEVLLAAYEAWGTDCFDRLDGMWGVVLLDLARRRLVVSRDRFGIKSLYWARSGARLLVASEVKQILDALGEPPRPDARMVARFLRGSRDPCTEATFFAGVRAVPPATWCAVDLDGDAVEEPVFHPYWRLSDHYCPAPDRPPLAYADALDAVERTLAAAVETHRAADVAVGSLLSGGLDSSLVATLAAESARKAGLELPGFSVGLGDEGALDELPFARSVAEKGGLVHHVARLHPEWFAANLERTIRAMEEPPLGMAALAQYRAFQLAREHGVTVVLDGQGADEVFGGYPGHQRIFVRDRIVHGRVVQGLREIRAMAAQRERPFVPFLAEYVGIGVTRRFPVDHSHLDPALGCAPDDEETAAAADFGRDPSPVNRELYHSVRWGNVRIVLPYSDKNAMAHSVEARVPYFDRALVELAFSLPDHFKVGGGQRKRLLRDAGRRRLPRDVTERKDKTGFATGEHDWLKKEMWPQVQAALDSGALASAFFRPGGAARFVADFAAGSHGDFRAVWRMCAFATWAAAFEVRLP